MKKLMLVTLSACLCGCANINNRVFNESLYSPFTEPYQSTSEAVAGCTFITVPQIVNPGPIQWTWLNLISVPIGACCFIVDVPLEAVCDTIWYPFDKWYVDKKKEDQDIN